MRRCPKVVQALQDQEAGVTVMTAAAEPTGKEKQLAELVAHLKYTWAEQRTQAPHRVRVGISGIPDGAILIVRVFVFSCVRCRIVIFVLVVSMFSTPVFFVY